MEKHTKSILLAGDYTNPTWHPFKNVDHILLALCEPLAKVSCTEHYESFSLEELCSYDLIVFYMDRWSDKAATYPWIVANLISYVTRGGALAVLHYPAVCESDVLAQMLGAKFCMHPPYQKIRYLPTKKEHPAMRGIEKFWLYDEPYHFTFSLFTERETLLEMEYGGQYVPAMWTCSYGTGIVTYLAPGHDENSFKNEQMQHILENTFVWMLG